MTVWALGYWRQRADERLSNPSCKDTRRLLVVKNKVGDLSVSKSVEYDTFISSVLSLLVGRPEGHLTCKMFDVGGGDLTGALHVL